MLAIISNRRRGVSWWVKALWVSVLIVVAVVLVVLIDRRTQPIKFTSTEDSPGTNETTDITTEPADLSRSDNNELNRSETVENQPADQAKIEVPPDNSSAQVSYEGTEVHLGSVTVKVPKQWYFSYSQESVGQLLNFGTQNFGPENPYQSSMADDGSGYLGPYESIPSEAVGSLQSTDTLTLNNGQSLEKRVYQGTTPDGIALTQVVAKFSGADKEYGIIFYTQTKNETQLRLLDDMLRLVAY